MLAFRIYHYLSFILFVALCVEAQVDRQNATIEYTCHLLNEKFAISSPWTAYPIVYEPINRGRLSIWTGVCTLPSSEFKCYGVGKPNLSAKNATSDIILNFANFANKLEWTFYDMNKGATYHGVSVNYYQDVKYKISLSNKQVNSYLECNTIDIIEQTPGLDKTISLQTACDECTQPQISLIESQIRELIKSRIDEQIMDNLYWQLSQLLQNQHFSGPISLMDSNSD